MRKHNQLDSVLVVLQIKTVYWHRKWSWVRISQHYFRGWCIESICM